MMHRDAYFRLAGMTALSFISVNQFYMAGLMTAPMVSIELLLVGSMYPQKKLNLILAIIEANIHELLRAPGGDDASWC